MEASGQQQASVPDPSANGQVISAGSGAVVYGGSFHTDSGDMYFGQVVTEQSSNDVHGLPNPYRGLRSYTYEEQAIYAGRSSYVEAAMRKLLNSGNGASLLFITGASGSGKSSFAQAGLLPALDAYYKNLDLIVRSAVIPPISYPLVEELLNYKLAQVRLEETRGRVANPDAFSKLLPREQGSTDVNVIVIDQLRSFSPKLVQSRELRP